jgi:predicted RNase H-like HicB family nuclease
MRVVILIEKGERNYSAYAPDVPGCVATGKSVEEVTRHMQDALEFHFEGMLLDGEPLPAVDTVAATVEVDFDRVEANVAAERKRPRRRAAPTPSPRRP